MMSCMLKLNDKIKVARTYAQNERGKDFQEGLKRTIHREIKL